MRREALPASSIGRLALAAVGERTRRLRRCACASRDMPTAGRVHDTRVAVRRLQACLRVFRPVLLLPSAVPNAPLRRVERRLGRLRDLDLLRDALIDLAVSDPADALCLALLRARLLEERAPALAFARAALDRRQYRRVMRALRRWAERPSFTPLAVLPAGQVVPELILPQLARTLLHPGWLIGTLSSIEDPRADALHRLRRRVKALRYAVESVEPVYGGAVRGCLGRLARIQDGLGAYHDWLTLYTRLRAEAVSQSLLQLPACRALAALQPWPRWRMLALDPRERAALRRILLLPGRRVYKLAAEASGVTAAPASAGVAVAPGD
jgi:CHAD domain-containing protein